MAQILVVPDSFKGSMTSMEVAEIIATEISKKTSKTILQIPIADGGEGSVDCVIGILGGKKYSVDVKSPEFKIITAKYGITDSNVGIIEFAESSGITKQTSYKTINATSYGFGEQILDLLDRGVRKFILCLGGSATTDGAAGMASCLGVKFYNSNGESFVPVGGTLGDICSIDMTSIDSRIKESEFLVMCDVTNPLFGLNGAAYVYGPQKGATKEDLNVLDEGLRNLCRVYNDVTGIDYSDLTGGGAAGGAGFGCVAFLNATLKSGIDLILDLCDFDHLVSDCELVITGEGKLDNQSLMGKVLSGVKKYAKGKRIVSFCGISELDSSVLEAENIEAIVIGRGIPLEEAIRNGKELLKKKASELEI